MKRFSEKKSISFLKRDRLRISALLVVMAVILCACTQGGTQYDVKCVFLEAGQGDSSLVMTRDGHCIMIDTGTVGYTDKIISSLHSMNVSVIDLLILTHNHEDHVAGSVEILERFSVKELWWIESTDNYITNAIESAANKNKTKIRFANEGDTLSVGEDLSVDVSVLCAYAEGEKLEENENAIVVSVSYLDFSALYMSDTGHKTEKYLLEHHKDKVNCDILKVGHHGSDSSSSEDFIKTADPQIAVISCERNNPYGHPHVSTVDLLDKYCEYTVYTYNGNFEALVKGGEISFEKKN